ncbi:MAG: glycosyltransferase family 2 protein [Armatimonadota bacterium]
MTTQPRPCVSVAIANWNTRDLLRACLGSLLGRTHGVRLEVIVVDNGSDDGSPQMVRAQWPEVTLIENADNEGFARATNQALRRASGEFLFLLNSDAEVRAGCVERLVEVASSDERIGAVGPKLLNTDGTRQASTGPFPRVIHRLLPSMFERRYDTGLQARLAASPDRTAQVDWICGAALLFRRDVLETVGFLDERFFVWYEDLDWCQRLRRAGYRCVYVAGAEVVHHRRKSAGRIRSRDLAQQLFDSEYTYLRLYGGRIGVASVFALRVAKALVRRALGSEQARSDAAFRLSYHLQHFRRFCLARWNSTPVWGG